MKKIIALLIIPVLMVSCYEDYMTDYDYDGVYFPWPTNVRTFVVGEGMEIEVGVVLGGVRENSRDRVVNFTIDNNLLTPEVLNQMKNSESYIKNAVASVTTLLPLPTNSYSLSDNKIVIKAGEHMGKIVMKADSANFLADPAATLVANYAVPFSITTADADTILESKRSVVIGFMYENMLFGNYYHGGVTTVKDAGGNTVETIIYYTSIPAQETQIWKLVTLSPTTLAAYGFSNVSSIKPEMQLTLNGDQITINSATGSNFEILADGASSFNRAKLLQKRQLFLNYKYVNGDGNTCYAKDTLTFRNRLRDGVNEWQDPNPSNYE